MKKSELVKSYTKKSKLASFLGKNNKSMYDLSSLKQMKNKKNK